MKAGDHGRQRKESLEIDHGGLLTKGTHHENRGGHTKGQKLREELAKTKILAEDGAHWNYMTRSVEKEQLVPANGKPLPMQKAYNMLQDLYRLIQVPGLLQRFHALKCLSKITTWEGQAVVP